MPEACKSLLSMTVTRPLSPRTADACLKVQSHSCLTPATCLHPYTQGFQPLAGFVEN